MKKYLSKFTRHRNSLGSTLSNSFRFKKAVKTQEVPCNICKNPFRANSIFDRFCGSCKQESELFRFSEWFTSGQVC